MSEIFGPGWGNYAIRGIVETSIPEQLSLLPATPGWWVIFCLLLGGLSHHIWNRWQHYLHNRYRRVAQAELDRLETAYKKGDRECLKELAPLLRATVLQGAPQRADLAAVREEAWHRALQAMAPELPPLPTTRLDTLAYKPPDDEICNLEPLFTDLRRWIALHEHPDA